MEYLTKRIEFFSVPFTADDADVVTFATETERYNFFENYKIFRPFAGNVDLNALTRYANLQWLDGQRNANISFSLNAGEEFEVNSFNYLRVTFLDAGQSDVNETRGNVFYFFVDRAERLYNTSSNVEQYTFRFFLTLDVWQTYVLQKQKPQKNSDDLIAPVLREFYLEQGNFEKFIISKTPYAQYTYGLPFLPDKKRLTRFSQQGGGVRSVENLYSCVGAFVFDGNIQLLASIGRPLEQCLSEASELNKIWNAIEIYEQRWTYNTTTELTNNNRRSNVKPLSCYIIPSAWLELWTSVNWTSDEAINAGGAVAPRITELNDDGYLSRYQVKYERATDTPSEEDTPETKFWFFLVKPTTKRQTFTFDASQYGDGYLPLQFGTLYSRITLPRQIGATATVECSTGATSNGLSITITGTGNAQPLDVTQNFTVPAPYSEAAQYFNQNGNSIAVGNLISLAGIVASVASQNYVGAVIGAASLTKNLIEQNNIRNTAETMNGNGYGDINVKVCGGVNWWVCDINDAFDGFLKEIEKLKTLQGYLYGGYTGDAFNATGLLNLSTTPRGVKVDKCLFIRGDAVIYGVNAETGKWLKNKLKTTGLRIWKSAAYRAEMA